jgi:hypothetical protein
MHIKAKSIYKFEERNRLVTSHGKIFTPYLDIDINTNLEHNKNQALEKFRVKFLLKNLQMNKKYKN